MINLVQLILGYEQLSREKIYDNYAWHQKAWNLFEHYSELEERNNKPEQEKGSTPFLSRYILKTKHAELLVVSKYKPQKPDWCPASQWKSIQINETYLSQPSYFFDLYANPTKKIKKENISGSFTKNGKRLTLMDSESQIEWIYRKGEKHGFTLDENIPLRIEKPVNHSFNRKGKRGLHIGVRFQGLLHVTDNTAFKKAFCEGIGTAKGFGFGLLMVKPAYI